MLCGCGSSRLGAKHALWAPPMVEAISHEAPELDLKQLELMIHEEANAVRIRKSKKPLTWSDTIAYVARLHSLDMAETGYFDHVNKAGEDPSDRAAKVGLSGTHKSGNQVIEGFGENLFATHRYSEYTVNSNQGEESYEVNWKQQEDIAREAVQAWMDSTPHRINLLSPAYSRQGIGVALGSNGTLFVTQNLY